MNFPPLSAFHFSTLGMSALVVCQQPVWAQTNASAQTVVVTGSVREQAVLDAPYAISSVNVDELASAGPMVNLSEVLARVPGLVVANRHNHAQDLQISSRGFGARAGFGVRGLRLYSDGIPATMPDGQGQVAHFDLAGAQRVEVLRGPFSVLYGNASGGVIALFSKPITQAQVQVAGEAGSFGLRQLRLNAAAPLGQGWELAASGAHMASTGFRPQSEAERDLANVRLGWKGDADRVVITFGHQKQKADDPLGLTRAQFDADARQTTPEAAQFDTRKTIDQTQAGLNWRHRFEGAGALRDSSVSAYGGDRAVAQWLAITPTTQANVRHGGGVIDFERRYAGMEARLNFAWQDIEATAGVAVEQMRDARLGFENFTGTAPNQVLGVTGKARRNEGNRARSSDVFGQAQWALSPAMNLTAGLRAGSVRLSSDDAYLSNGDDSGSVTYHFANPVVGVRWKAGSGLTLHASVARGYESPTLGELAYGPNGVGGFNTGLKGQTSRQMELGAKWRAGPVAVDVAAFLARTEDEIGVNTNSGGRQSFQNVGRTRRSGLEGSMNWQVLPQWRTQLAFTVLDATYRDAFLACPGIPCTSTTVKLPVAAGNRIAGTQRLSGWAELAWQPLVGTEFALEWRGMGGTMANDRNSEAAPGYGLANLRASHEWALGREGMKLQVMARADNFLNRAHSGSVIVNEANGRYYEPGAPRSLMLSVRLQQRF
jgi:iron complex outermembrane recepter protein